MLRRYHRGGAQMIGVALLLAPRLAASAADPLSPPLPPPIGWREPAPLARLFLQLPFEAPEVVPPGRFQAELRLLYSNSLLLGSDDAFTLDVHVETAQPTIALRYGVARDVEAELAIPFAVDTGGFLDRPIEIVEGWFGFENPQRLGRPRNVARFRLVRPDGSGIDRSGAGAGLGDVWAAVKVRLAGAILGGGSLAVRAAVKVPSGRLPYGSEEVDLGGGVLAAWAWSRTAVRLEVDGMAPTADLPEVHVRTRPYGSAFVGATHSLSDRVALHVQASGHLSPLHGTGLGQLDDATAYVLVGATFDLGRGATLEAGVVENVFSPYRGADITFPVALSVPL